MTTVGDAVCLLLLCRVCMSVGSLKVAVCGAEVKTSGPSALFRAFRDKALFANLTAAGTLVQFPGDPAVNATPYTQQCSNLSSPSSA